MYYCSNLLCNSIPRAGERIICSNCFSPAYYGQPKLLTPEEIPDLLLNIKSVTENGILKVKNESVIVDINL